MSRVRERYLWVAGIMFLLACLALALDWVILQTVLVYWIGLCIGRFVESGKEREQ